jgi:hypothetical protein
MWLESLKWVFEKKTIPIKTQNDLLKTGCVIDNVNNVEDGFFISWDRELKTVKFFFRNLDIRTWCFKSLGMVKFKQLKM